MNGHTSGQNGGRPDSQMSGHRVRRPQGRPLRGRLLAAIVGSAALAVALFAVPLAFAVQRLYRDEAISRLERDAARIAAEAPDDIAFHPRPLPSIAGLSPHLKVGIYRVSGTRITGAGPYRSWVAAQAAGARLRHGVEKTD